MVELVHGAGDGGFGAGDGDDDVEDVDGAEDVPGDEGWFRVREE